MLVLGKNRISNLDSEAKQSSKIFKLIKMRVQLVGFVSTVKMIKQVIHIFMHSVTLKPFADRLYCQSVECAEKKMMQ